MEALPTAPIEVTPLYAPGNIEEPSQVVASRVNLTPDQLRVLIDLASTARHLIRNIAHLRVANLLVRNIKEHRVELAIDADREIEVVWERG